MTFCKAENLFVIPIMERRLEKLEALSNVQHRKSDDEMKFFPISFITGFQIHLSNVYAWWSEEKTNVDCRADGAENISLSRYRQNRTMERTRLSVIWSGAQGLTISHTILDIGPGEHEKKRRPTANDDKRKILRMYDMDYSLSGDLVSNVGSRTWKDVL